MAATLDVWDEQLAALGAELMAARLTTLADLEPLLAHAYADIAPTRNVARVGYRAAVLGEEEAGGSPGAAALAPALVELMRRRRSEEIARGVCLVGPHRDDVVLHLGDLPAQRVRLPR